MKSRFIQPFKTLNFKAKALAVSTFLLAALPIQAAPSKSKKPIITQAVLSKGFNGAPQNVTNRFAPTDRTFHLTVRFNRPSNGDRVKTAWIIADAGGVKNYRFAEKTLSTRQMDALHFATSLRKNWPRGKYRADVFLNGMRAKQLYFVVQ